MEIEHYLMELRSLPASLDYFYCPSSSIANNPTLVPSRATEIRGVNSHLFTMIHMKHHHTPSLVSMISSVWTMISGLYTAVKVLSSEAHYNLYCDFRPDASRRLLGESYLLLVGSKGSTKDRLQEFHSNHFFSHSPQSLRIFLGVELNHL